MNLCKHILPVYRNEIKHGNRPLYVSTPKYVDTSATAEIYVTMKNKLQSYDLSELQEYRYTDYHFPRERYYGCPICKHYISGPLDENQNNWFKHSDFDIPNMHVTANDDNIYIDDGVYGKNIVPTVILTVIIK